MGSSHSLHSQSSCAAPLLLLRTSRVDTMEDEAEEECMEVQLFLESALMVAQHIRKRKKKIDGRTLPRSLRTKYRHAEALHCIKRDYLGIPDDLGSPIFNGREFDSMFRISRSRFQRLMEDFAATGDPFYLSTEDCFGHEIASFEARMLLPLKSIAFGVPPKTFRDYFQMSKTLARDCCINFYRKIRTVYESEYLRTPTKEDLKAITRLHQNVHKVPGMVGSLDCMHTYWKNCPVAWQGSYKGSKSKPSIVLEAMSDHHLFFWHCAYGYAGTLNDINILNLSPLLESFRDGSFEKLEDEICPFMIGTSAFQFLYILVDGIYPRWSRFVRGIKEPITQKEKTFTGFQESARKDIERAFGVLQAKFQILARPITLMDPELIGVMVACLILHNMCVSDRIMDGDVYARYNPAEDLSEDEGEVVEDPPELIELKKTMKVQERAKISIRNADPSVQKILIRKKRWESLQNKEEHGRLAEALMDFIFND